MKLSGSFKIFQTKKTAINFWCFAFLNLFVAVSLISFTVSLTGCTANAPAERPPAEGNTILPSAPKLDPPTVNSPATATYYSNGSTLSISGTCTVAPGTKVFLGGDEDKQTTCSSNGDFTFTVNKTNDGTYNFTLRQESLIHHPSDNTTLTWQRNTVPPASPTITTPSSHPVISSSSTFSIAGSCVPTLKVDLTGDSTQNTTCASGGTYSFTVSKAVDGTFVFQIYQTDIYGNISTNAQTSWTRDTVVPATPVISSPTQNPYTSNESSFALNGSCAAGTTIKLSGDMTDSTSCGAGVFSFDLNASTYGTFNYSIIAVGANALQSTAATFQWVRTGAVPPTPILSSPLSNPIYSNSNNLIISGSCADGNTVYLTGSHSTSAVCASSSFSFTVTKNADGNYNFSVYQEAAGTPSGAVDISWTRDTVLPLAPIVTLPGVTPYTSSSNSLLISGTCDSGNSVYLTGSASNMVQCSSGSFSFTVVKNVDATYNFSVSQMDLAGNTSAGTSVQWIVDTTPPSAPTVTSPASSPLVNSASSITITGACENSATVNLSGSATSNTTCSSNAYTFTVNKNTDATYNFSISQTDSAGLISPSKSVQWIRDTVAPASPTITNPAQNPMTSNDTNITIGGSCESGTTVNYSGATTGTTPCSLGSYSFGLSKNVDGVYNVSVSQTDAANNASSATSFQWTRLSSIPETPVISSPASTPYYSKTNSLTISGSCTTGNTVQLSGAQTDSVTCAASSYSFNLLQVVDGSYNYSVSQVNASSISSGSASFVWVVDTMAPSTPVVTSPAVATTISSSNSLTIEGNCEANSTIHYSGSASGTTTCGLSNTFSFTVNKTTDGIYNISISQADRASNFSGSVSINWQRDTLPPATPTLSQPNANPYTSGDTSITIGGACEAGATVNISGGSSQQTTCSITNTYSFVVSKTADGTYSFSVTQTDSAANVSSALNFQWLRDTTIPFTPVVTSPVTDNYYSNGSTVSISVTCQTGLSPQNAVVSLSGVAAADVITPAGTLTQNCVTSPITYVIQKNADGIYNFTFSQENPNNANVSADAVFTWHRDTVVPATPTLTSPSINPYTGPGSISVAGSCENNATVNLAGDAIQSVTCANNTFNFSVIKSTDATYSFSVAQTDLAGNISPGASVTWVRNSSSLPPPTITSPASTPYSSTLQSLLLSGGCQPQYTVTIAGDISSSDVTDPANSLTQTCSSAGTYSFAINKTNDGTFNFQLTESYNSATSAATLFTWKRDTTAPTTNISSSAQNPNLLTSIQLSFSANETATFQCSLNGSTYQSCSSPITYSGLINGAQSLSVIATDSVGNIGAAATYNWTQAAYNSVAIYHLNAGTGTALDDSGLFTSTNAFNNNLSSFGSPGTNTTGKLPTASPLSFNLGTGKYFSVANNGSINSTANTMTVEGWFLFNNLPSSAEQYYSLFSNTGSAPDLGWELLLQKKSSGGCNKFKLIFNASLDGATQTSLPSSSCITLSANKWYYVALTWNRGTVNFYMSLSGATSRGSGIIGTAGASSLWTPNVPFRIGANVTSGTGSSLWLDGAVDEVRISNIVRTVGAPATEYTAD